MSDADASKFAELVAALAALRDAEALGLHHHIVDSRRDVVMALWEQCSPWTPTDRATLEAAVSQTGTVAEAQGITDH